MRTLVFVAMLAIAADGAHAGLLGKLVGGATGAAALSGGRKTYDPNTLTPAQLKVCLVDAHQIDVGTDRFEQDRKALETLHDELLALAGQLKGKSERNPQVIAFRNQQKAFNASVDAANARLADVRVIRERFALGCNNKRYFQSDIQQVKSELPADVARSMGK
jgi:hypothetical protein